MPRVKAGALGGKMLKYDNVRADNARAVIEEANEEEMEDSAGGVGTGEGQKASPIERLGHRRLL